jgi:hypothetical protein
MRLAAIGRSLPDPRQIFGSSLSNTADSTPATKWITLDTFRGAPVVALMAKLYQLHTN